MTERGLAKESIRVRFGEPFSISLEDLNSEEKRWEDSILVKTFALNVEGMYKGRIEVVKDATLIDATIDLRTPAGPVELKYRIDDKSPEVITESVPLRFDLILDKVPEDRVATVGFDLIFDDKNFKGESTYDDIELLQNGNAGVKFLSWIDPETRAPCEVYFPQNIEIINKVRFIVREE